MKCPNCGSDNIDQTDKIDLTMIDPKECHHDFECYDCECVFLIVYTAIRASVVEMPNLSFLLENQNS